MTELATTEKVKPGYKTTEFWLSLICAGAGLALILNEQTQLGALLLGLAGLSYNGSRGLTKLFASKETA